MAARLAELLEEFEVRRFPEGTRTAEDAARAIGCRLGQIVKSLVFVAAGRPVVALVSGESRLDPARLADLAGEPVAKADAETNRARCRSTRLSGRRKGELMRVAADVFRAGEMEVRSRVPPFVEPI